MFEGNFPGKLESSDLSREILSTVSFQNFMFVFAA